MLRLRLLPLLVAILLLLLVHMVLLASSRPEQRHLTLHASGWPQGMPPMRLALLSDLHVSTPGDTPARLAETVARINATHPDLVLIAGDFISTGADLTRAAPTAAALAPLAALHARLGTIAVLGNHDYGDEAGVRAGLRRAGIRLLDNQVLRVGPLAILGLSDANTGHDRLAPVLAQWRRLGGVPLLLTHDPDPIAHLPAPIGLAFAGHTHCGQVDLPGFGPIVTNSRYGDRYACGLVREGGRLSLISGGLGTSNLPIRLDSPPHFWIVDLGH